METKFKLQFNKIIVGIYEYTDDFEQNVNECIKKANIICIAEIVRQTGINERSVRRRVNSLENSYVIETLDTGYYRLCAPTKHVQIGPYVIHISITTGA
jgi:tRNA G37 N-methylase Trm5